MKNIRLANARKIKGFTQGNLAELLGKTKATVSNWENGYSNPSLVDAFRVAELLQCEVSEIFSGIAVQETYTNDEKEVI